MKQILAIAIGILMMGSDASEAKEITGKVAENIIVKGKIIGSFLPPEHHSVTLIVIYKNRYYHCKSRIKFSSTPPLSLRCWNQD